MASRKADKILELLYKLNFWKFTSLIKPSQLTVLNYHRIEDINSHKSLFKPNISALPEIFGSQLDYLRENFNVISLDQLVNWLSGLGKLPPNSALITFDDGYLDNYTNAFPALKTRNLPAVIFLTTGFIGKPQPFYWDLLAYCFQHTMKDNITVPSIGHFRWDNYDQRNDVARKVIENLKMFPEDEKRNLVNDIQKELKTSIPDGAFTNLFLNWDHVRELVNGNIEMGAHTVNHPILTRIPLDIALNEILASKKMIEEEIDKEVVSLAYPNGQFGDFNNEIINTVKQVGFKAAFTLISGPQDYKDVKRNQFTIRRVFLSYKDSLARFAAKIHGLPHLLNHIGRDLG